MAAMKIPREGSENSHLLGSNKVTMPTASQPNQQEILCSLADSIPWILSLRFQRWTCTSQVHDDTICSSWQGISCHVNSNQTVTHVLFDKNEGGGSIPETVGNLVSLQHLTFSSVGIKGSLPTSLGKLTNLQSLIMSNNEITGILPTALGHLTNLKILSLSQNKLFGRVPSSYGNLRSLVTMQLSNNQLTGILPSSMGNFSQNLRAIYLGNNFLSGQIPPSFSQLMSVKVLDLENNQFSGKLDMFCSLSSLTSLIIARNNISGPIPDCFGRMISIQTLNLASNGISGSIPQAIGHLVALQNLDFHSNQLTGQFPYSMQNMKYIRNLALQENDLTGTLPSYIGLIPNLITLNIRSNKFWGHVPTTLSLLTSLALIDLRNNSFNAESICTPLTSQGIVRYPHCQDAQDSAICDFVSATSVTNAVKNLITFTSVKLGNISSRPHHWTRNLNASNVLCVSISSAQQYAVSFKSPFHAGQGSFELSLCTDELCSVNYRSFTFQSLHDNSSKSVVTSLPSLMIKAASFFIIIRRPQPVTDNRYLDHLLQITAWRTLGKGWVCEKGYAQGLCESAWTGVTCNGGRVSDVDLSSLGIIGVIPSSIGGLVELKYLNLQSNNLRGDIPASGLSQLTGLTLLNLSNNTLTGTFPSTLGSLRSLKYLDLSLNKIQGAVPRSVGYLTQLNILSLGSNNLSGDLPRELCTLTMADINVTGNPRLSCFESLCAMSDFGTNRSLESRRTIRPPDLPLCPQRLTAFSLLNAASSAKISASDEMPPPISTSASDTYSYRLTVIVVSVASALAMFLFFVASCSVLYLRRKKLARAVLLRERSLKLRDLPVHRAILERIDPDKILLLISENLSSVLLKNSDGDTAFDFALEYSECDMRVITLLLLNSLPIDKVTKSNICSEMHGYAWSKAVQLDRFAEAISSILSEYPVLAYELSRVTDLERRCAVDIASPKIKRLIMMNLYMLKRYDVTTMDTPHHKSETCVVHLAIDRDDNDRRVALKFMKDRDQFLREVRSRSRGAYSEEHVVGILRVYDGADDGLFLEEMQRKGLGTYRHCIVMEAGDRSLYDILVKENIAGKNMDYIKLIACDLAKAVQHVHSKGFIHGDLKPLNIMRVEQRMKLIDFDASVSFVELEESSCSKYSSGYLPPELIHSDDFKVCVKSCAGFDTMALNMVSYNSTATLSSDYNPRFFLSNGLTLNTSRRSSVTLTDDPDPSETPDLVHYCDGEQDGFFGFGPMPPSPSQDIWALGLVLFQLASNSSLFNCDGEGNIDDVQLRVLANWTDCTKIQQLLRVKDPYARNLLSLMLSKDPKKRLNINQVLSHSFLTGRKATRLAGDAAKYDVFLSYRVASDLQHATALYEQLTARGIKVWWDVKCLKVGEQWVDGFCTGLVKSSIFLPLLSRGAVKHPTVARQNFELLNSDSPCDNVFLEHRLALELKERGLVEKICPLFFGDQDSTGTYKKYTFEGPESCHPSCPSVTVQTVEEKIKRDLDKQGQGMPFFESLTVKEVMSEIACYQGAFVVGALEPSIAIVVELVVQMLDKESTPRPPRQLRTPRHDFLSQDFLNSFKSLSP